VLNGLVAVAVAASSGAAQDAEDLNPHSDALLVAEVEAIQPGEPFTVALRLTMDDGWHSYWMNPGDAGRATNIQWYLPPGFAAGEIQWPYPEYIEEQQLASYGYRDEVFLLVEIHPPDRLPVGRTVRLAALADWVVCERICLPAEASVGLDLPVMMGEPPIDKRWQRQITNARRLLPVHSDDWLASAWSTESGFVLELLAQVPWDGDADGMRFFASDNAVIAYAAPQPLSTLGRAHRLTLTSSAFRARIHDRLRGVVVAPVGVTWDGRARALAVDAVVGPAPAPEGGRRP
jgi:thiol:disulfide interchange protein DsbD